MLDREGRAHATARRGKVAIYLQVANLYLERFSNQAEAIKAFEKVLELDPNNQQAVEHLLAVYEKRRDWEKLIKLKEAEIERAPDERARGQGDRGRAHGGDQGQEARDLHVLVGEGRPVRADPRRGARPSSTSSTSATRSGTSSPTSASRQADAATDDKVRADALQRLGLLYTEKVENSAQGDRRVAALLAIDENNRRAQDALKKLYVTEGRWDELEEFYTSRGKIDEYIRVLEREVEAGSETAPARRSR